MSLSARPHPITTYDKTTNIYGLVTFCTNNGILPNVPKELNLIGKNLKVVKVSVSDDDIVEVTILDNWNNKKRHTMDLQNHR